MTLCDESFGIIPLRKNQKKWQVFLVCKNENRYWGFPKGHKEKNEKGIEAAARELKEETSLTVKRFLDLDPLIETYTFHYKKEIIYKTVYYFIAEVEGEAMVDQREIAQGEWLSFADAERRLTYAEAKKVLSDVQKKTED